MRASSHRHLPIRVLFKTVVELLLDLGGQESTRGLARRLNYDAPRGLFVLDEIGYLSYDAQVQTHQAKASPSLSHTPLPTN